MRRFVLVPCAFLLLALQTFAQEKSQGSPDENSLITIASEGKSHFAIVIPENAPDSVRQAASELQQSVKLATQAELEIIADNIPTEKPVISVGQTRQAVLEGVSSQGVEAGGFRILTKSGSLYIIGPDTLDGEWTELGGTSTGSANGVYAFLEKFLDVRWLLPGDLGRDVPPRSTWKISEINHEETPFFQMRDISHLEDFANPAQAAEVRKWKAREKLGSSSNIRREGSNPQDHWQHNWMWLTDDREVFKNHPEWFALNAEGKRWNPMNRYAKLETTNQQLIEHFAEKAVETLKASSRPRYFSLTPNDAPSRWSESEESKAWYDPPIGSGRETEEFKPGAASKTSLVMKWYYDVAKVVEREYPQGKLTGFIYSDYLFPPVKFKEKLPKNISLILCGPNYGYELSENDSRERLSMLLKSWNALTPGGLYYYDIPSLLLRQEDSDSQFNFPGTTAIITPPGVNNLNYLFRTLFENKIKGAYLYGAASWSNAGMTNYILAKMLWDPQLDAVELRREWLKRAYGETAGSKMEKLYQALESYYGDYGHIGYRLTGPMLEKIYALHFREIESLFEAAYRQPMTSQQSERLSLTRDNLMVLQWRLRNTKLLPAEYKSSLTASDAEIIEMISDSASEIALFPGVFPSPSSFQRNETFFKRVNFRPSEGAGLGQKRVPKLPENTLAVIYAAKDGEVVIVPQAVDHGAYVSTYLIKDGSGAVVCSGMLEKDNPIAFNASAGMVYTLHIPPRDRRTSYPSSCELRIPGAVWADASVEGGVVSMRDEGADIYVFSDPKSMVAEVSPSGRSDVVIKKSKKE